MWHFLMSHLKTWITSFFLDATSQEEAEEENTMPSNFYYDYDEFVSKPYTTDGVPHDMLSL